MTFEDFKLKLQQNFQLMITGQIQLYLTNVNKEIIWETYLNAFPEEERQAHNCNSCRQFLKPYANVVAIVNNKVVSMWDIECEEPFKTVAMWLNHLVTSAPIRDIFVSDVPKLGTDHNFQQLEDGGVKRWNHFQVILPSSFVTRLQRGQSIESIQGLARDTRNVFQRSLEDISMYALNTTLELIEQNSIYRGAEFKGVIEQFLKLKEVYDRLPIDDRGNYCWAEYGKHGTTVTKIRGTAIGTLLVDIANGIELDVAVGKFEAIMAPANYKRPTAVITKKQIEEAQLKLQDMGLVDSLGRRYAHVDDITVNNVLFVDREAKKASAPDVFGSLKEDVPVNPKTFSKVEEVSIDDFIEKIVPKAAKIEVLVENGHENNLVSLIAPAKTDAPSLFKWDNGFSWAYNNNVADSMKERVKAAGGNVSGVLRFSIQWNEDGRSICDFDAHAQEPGAGGRHISFQSYRGNRTPMSGMLDVDMIRPSKVGVENITWTDRNQMADGVYVMSIHNYDNGHNTGFTAEVECDGQIYAFSYTGNAKGTIRVAEVTLNRGIFTVKSLIDSKLGAVKSTNMWGVSTNKFQKVAMIMSSPNYWDGKGVGNRHTFFMLDKCKNPDTPRGFFNEFLKEDLMQQKRVFEALGDKMKVSPSEDQLSGLGFSSTNKASVICRVEGSFSRVLKVNF